MVSGRGEGKEGEETNLAFLKINFDFFLFFQVRLVLIQKYYYLLFFVYTFDDEMKTRKNVFLTFVKKRFHTTILDDFLFLFVSSLAPHSLPPPPTSKQTKSKRFNVFFLFSSRIQSYKRLTMTMMNKQNVTNDELSFFFIHSIFVTLFPDLFIYLSIINNNNNNIQIDFFSLIRPRRFAKQTNKFLSAIFFFHATNSIIRTSQILIKKISFLIF